MSNAGTRKTASFKPTGKPRPGGKRSTKSSKQRTLPFRPPVWDGWERDIGGLILLVSGIVVLFSLASYKARDASWNTATPGQVQNLIGPFGARIADLLFQTLGFPALLIPLLLLTAGWWLLREKEREVSFVKMFGWLLLMLALTGGLALLDSRIGGFPDGGWIGNVVMHDPQIGVVSSLNRIGALILLIAIFLAGLVISTRFSLRGLAGLIMNFTPHEQKLGVWDALTERFNKWSERRALDRQRRDIAYTNTAKQTREILVGGRSGAAPVPRGKTGRLAPVGKAGEQDAVAPVQNPAVPDFDDEDNGRRQPFKPAVVRPESPLPPAGRPAGGADAVNGAGGAPKRRTTNLTVVKPHRRAEPPPWEEAAEAEEFSGEVELGQPDGEEEDFSDHTGAQRSVADMMATASVTRTVSAEEPDKPRTTGQMRLFRGLSKLFEHYKLPASEVLTPPAPRSEVADAELLDRAKLLAEKCKEFNVSGQVMQISPGPVVTTFEFKPDRGVKYSRVTGLVDDLCLGLKAESIRIDRMPGKSTVGIEVPNTTREIIRLREVIESKKFRDSESKLTLALGKTIDGSNYVADLARMPHLLIAGATGAGKSVALNSVLLSMLYKASPDEVKFILVDPKRLELGLYADIPHLLTPIVTDPKRAGYSLKWAVAEMENRYKHLASFGVRNIDQYNQEVGSMDRSQLKEGEEAPASLPYIVIIIDELADLMMVAARDVEESITRLAQMARAVGIHLVLATQRPSVDVITGLIKANFPSRISFRVSSKVDSRTIIDTNGAEALLGQGDMLFLPPGTSRLVRVHGAYVDEKEVKRICDFIRAQGKPAYDDKVTMSDKEIEGAEYDGDLKQDEKYDEALRIVLEMGRASTSVLQRRLRIGYGRAASIIDMMHREGIVGPEDGSKARQVLIKPDDRGAFLERLEQIREDGL